MLALDLTGKDSASGRVDVAFALRGTGDLWLDFRGRRVSRITVNGSDQPVTFADGQHIRLPGRALRRGENRVAVEFVTSVAAAGASIIRARDAGDGSEYLYTLLVPADANQLFPCFDQPDLKARVALRLTAAREWTVVGNGSITRADTSGDRVTTSFAETRPLSTYLIAFAAGPWAKATRSEQGRNITLYYRRSRASEVDSDSLLVQSHAALRWMESYFARRYPFEKFDIMLAPAFPFGGMEHPGLVMYSEDRFVFRDRPTLSRRMGRFSTILHETAHQWFGDLVTMKWFDDLWLKEGFATYIGAKALSELHPEADAWKVFYQSNKPSAYGVDQTTGTTSLWQRLGNLDQAKSAYGPIVYNKAPSVLKQLDHMVGDSAFRRGVQRFLTSHAYGNATWRDLLTAIGAASGTRLDEFGRQFMLRPGMPIVEPRLVTANGQVVSLELHQRPAQPGISNAGAWPMRTRVLLAYENAAPAFVDVSLAGPVTRVAAAVGRPTPAFVFPNSGDFGYFVSLLDSASVRALQAGRLRATEDPFLRTMLWGALWDQVREVRFSPRRFAELAIQEIPHERDEQILPTIISRLDRAIRAYVLDADAAVLRPQAEDALWALAVDRSRPFGIRRAALDGFVGIASSAGGVARLHGLLSADSAAGEPMRDPTRWSVVTRLLAIGAADADTARVRQAARDTTPDGRRRAFIAGVAAPSGAAKAQYFSRYFADSTLNEDWASGSLGAFNALEHEALTRPFLRAALDSLPYVQQNRRIFFLGSWLGAFISGQRSAEALDSVRGWLRQQPSLATDLRQKVLQSLDELDRTVRIRAAASATAPTGALP